MFDTLTDRLQETMKSLRGDSKLTPENMEEAIREVRKALLEADVSLKVVKLFISRIRQKALGEEVIESVSPAQQFIKIVHDELVEILGGENVPLNFKGSPSVLMLLGLQGSGKTTACAKLAVRLRKEGQKPLMVACDIQRPAAIKQLQTLGKQVDIPVFSLADSTNVLEIATQAVAEAKKAGYSPVILDTAGRLQIDTDLMAELLLLDRALEPAEKLLVIDAMTGQESVNVTETFNTQIGVTGVLLAKVDGDARGGAALSVREASGQPIKFISTGEKLDNLDAFYPDRMASRILGMGDVVALVEKAQDAIDEKEAEKVAKQMFAGEFTLEMFLQSQRMMKRMGSLGDIMKMMGVGGMLGLSSEQQSTIATHGEKMLHLYETAINSMTVAERQRPEIINMSRRRRIARGSGLKDNEIGQMLNEFEQMRKMFGQFHKMTGGMQFPGMPGMPGMGKGGAMPDLQDLAKNLPQMPSPGGFSGQNLPRPGGGNIFRKKNKKRF
ncbi:MAG: signal recognition particle protein [Candidatus Obscuribacterales bacterium]|nr:signal recognition particle protein [Candidatus Obscuribacterales bacterium]